MVLREVIKCIDCKKYLGFHPSNLEGHFLYCKCGFVSSLQFSRKETDDVEEVNNDITHLLKDRYSK